MKQCPACNAVYHDPMLLFCTADGSPLIGGPVSAATVQLRNDAAQSTTAKTILKIVIALVAVGILAIAAAGVAGVIYFYRTSPSYSGVPSATPGPEPTATPVTAADPTGDLQEQLAKLEKLLTEQLSGNGSGDEPLTLPFDMNNPRTARVNSPGDGFLTLRTMPNHQIGKRVGQIPHGEVITVGMCVNSERIGQRTGSWCRTNYKGQSGWVFDAWLDYETPADNKRAE